MSACLEATPTPKQKSWKRWTARQLRNLAVLYLVVLAVLLFLENKLIFRPVLASDDWLSPPNALVQDVELQTADGTRIHGWWCPVPGWRPEQGALLYCHGNAGNLSWRAQAIAHWQKEMNQSIFIFDYPGFGRSEGKPFEEGLYRDARAAYGWWEASRGRSGEKLVLLGESLGGAVATELATRAPVAGLIVQSSFTSARDMARTMLPLGLLQPLAGVRFDSAARISNLRCPKLVIHGDRDEIIPFRLGRRLFELAAPPKDFYVVGGAGHNDLPWVGGAEYVRRIARFLEAL